MLHFFYYLFLTDQIQVTQPQIDVGVEYFWQIIATIFGAILLWLFKRDLDKRDRRAKEMYEAINTLKTEFAVISSDVEHIRNDLDKLMEGR